MEFNEFSKQVRKVYSPRGEFKVKNSWGIYDAFKHIRKNKWYDIGRPLKEHEFYTIIRSINNLLAEEIANGGTVVFPSRMGKLELRKFERGVGIVNGKLIVTYPINWEETLRLWFEDEEAKKDKVLLRNEDKYVYRVKYCKFGANYKNVGFYEFVLNRFIKQALRKNIDNGLIDTLW